MTPDRFAELERRNAVLEERVKSLEAWSTKQEAQTSRLADAVGSLQGHVLVITSTVENLASRVAQISDRFWQVGVKIAVPLGVAFLLAWFGLR